MTRQMKYYKDKYLGVVGCYPRHEDGKYTFIPGMRLEHTWICTKDLHNSESQAKKSRIAQYALEERE